VVAFSFIALLLLAVPIILVAVLGMVLALASRHSRVAGLAILTIVGVLLVGIALLVWVRVGHDVHYAEGYDEVSTVAPPIESPEWISVEEGIVPVVAVDEEGAASTVSDTDAGADESAGEPADAEAVKAPAGEPAAATADAVTSESDTAEADSTDVAADYRPTDPDRAEVAEIKRYLDEAGSRAGIASDVDALSPGAILPPEPPPWVNLAAFNIDRVAYRPVTSGPYATRDECRRALAEAMKRAVDEYVDEYHGRPEAADYVDIDLAYIKTHLRHGDVYQEQVQASFGPMIQQHALLEFGHDFQEEIERRWQQVKVTSRLAHVSLAALAILAGLATIFAYLRLDTATKGYYSGRLQIAAGAVILGLVALGILTARWIPWL
jgi:hypothetical protein